MLFTELGCSVWEKNCALDLEYGLGYNGPRPKAQFFPAIPTSHTVNNITYVLFTIQHHCFIL